MKVLFVGDDNFGDRDREADIIYHALCVLIRTNAKRNGDDLVVLHGNKTYFDSVVKQIVETMEGETEVNLLNHEALAHRMEVTQKTKVVAGSSNTTLRKQLAKMDPEVDLVAAFSDDLVNSECASFVKAARSKGFGVTNVNKRYNVQAIPNELQPEPIMYTPLDGSDPVPLTDVLPKT